MGGLPLGARSLRLLRPMPSGAGGGEMTWARLDDSFQDHPKVRALLRERDGGDALSLHILAISWSARHLTDGVVTDPQLPELMSWDIRRLRARVRALLRAHLWDQIDAGIWRVHDYLDYNMSRDEVLAKRKIERERRAKHRKLSQRDTTRDTARDVIGPIPIPIDNDLRHHLVGPVETVDNASSDLARVSSRLVSVCQPGASIEEATAVVTTLAGYLDTSTIDELVGRCASAKPASPRYLLNVARNHGRETGIVIPGAFG